MFLYFIPNISAEELTSEDNFRRSALPAVLQCVLADCQKIKRDIILSPVRGGIGPGGASGVVIAPLSREFGPPPEFSYQPGLQTWLPVGDPQNPVFFIGYCNDRQPAPENLLRRDFVPGYTMTDDGGREWRIPIARAPGDEFGTLPQSYGFDAVTGAVRRKLKPERREFWQFCGEIWDYFNREFEAQSESAKDSTTIDAPGDSAIPIAERPDFDWLAAAALRVLQVNYRVGPAELDVLESFGGCVLDQSAIYAATQAAIGFDLLDEATKKKNALIGAQALNGSPGTTGESTPLVAPGIALRTPDSISPPSTIEVSSPTKSTTTFISDPPRTDCEVIEGDACSDPDYRRRRKDDP